MFGINLSQTLDIHFGTNELQVVFRQVQFIKYTFLQTSCRESVRLLIHHAAEGGEHYDSYARMCLCKKKPCTVILKIRILYGILCKFYMNVYEKDMFEKNLHNSSQNHSKTIGLRSCQGFQQILHPRF